MNDYLSKEELMQKLQKIRNNNTIIADPIIKWFADTVEELIKNVQKDSKAYCINLEQDTPSLFECSRCSGYIWDTVPIDGEIKYCPFCGLPIKEGE